MTIHIGVESSVGFVRKINIHNQESGEIQLDFIAAFGGVNGSIGAKNAFELSLDANCKTISICRYNGYETVLEKNIHSGEWSNKFPFINDLCVMFNLSKLAATRDF